MTKELQLGVSNRYVRTALLSMWYFTTAADPITQSITLIVFFAPYVIAQYPASILVRKIGPRIFLSSITLTWGIVMMVSRF